MPLLLYVLEHPYSQTVRCYSGRLLVLAAAAAGAVAAARAAAAAAPVAAARAAAAPRTSPFPPPLPTPPLYYSFSPRVHLDLQYLPCGRLKCEMLPWLHPCWYGGLNHASLRCRLRLHLHRVAHRVPNKCQ